MKILKQEDMEMMERKLLPWFERTGYPPSSFRDLDHYYQVLLYDLAYLRTRCPSDLELKRLIKKLNTSAARVKGLSADQVEGQTREQLMEIFLPQNYLRKF